LARIVDERDVSLVFVVALDLEDAEACLVWTGPRPHFEEAVHRLRLHHRAVHAGSLDRFAAFPIHVLVGVADVLGCASSHNQRSIVLDDSVGCDDVHGGELNLAEQLFLYDLHGYSSIASNGSNEA